MTDTPETPTPETAAEALKRVLAAKKAASTAGGPAFKPAQHPEQAVSARNTALAKPAFRKASKRG
ncbi:hypothetical protein BH10PSE2_BH10PSE2_03080 [soil metagenome]